MGEDVPQEEDEDAGRKRVEKTLNHFRQAMHARDRKAEKNGRACDGAQSDRGGLAHSCPMRLVRTTDAIRSV